MPRPDRSTIPGAASAPRPLADHVPPPRCRANEILRTTGFIPRRCDETCPGVVCDEDEKQVAVPQQGVCVCQPNFIRVIIREAQGHVTNNCWPIAEFCHRDPPLLD